MTANPFTAFFARAWGRCVKSQFVHAVHAAGRTACSSVNGQRVTGSIRGIGAGAASVGVESAMVNREYAEDTAEKGRYISAAFINGISLPSFVARGVHFTSTHAIAQAAVWSGHVIARGRAKLYRK